MPDRNFIEQRIKEIEERLNEVERVRPGRWFTTLGSGNNVCTSISAEIIGPRLDGDGNKVDKPEACPYRLDNMNCGYYERPWQSFKCTDADKFSDGWCPLEPTRDDTCFVLDCLPEWILKDYPSTPEHGPLLKFFEMIKLDVRFLIDEVKKLKEDTE